MNILDQIVERKRAEVAKLPKLPVTAKGLGAAVNARTDRRDFAAALRQPRQGTIGLIAEVKKASPSAGLICADFDPARIAREYEVAGADCLSVLTDEHFFQGSLAFLKQIRNAVKLPLLRKDFIIDARQIRESIEWGADAVLLIVAILTDPQLKEFHDLATTAGLAALVEVHDKAELERALAVEATLIGVNNRNLKDFTVSLETTERLAQAIAVAPRSGGVTLVAESGIHHRSDVERLARAGAKAVLVGEALMKSGNIRAKVSELMGK